ncbi:MAG: hypothetical protein ACK4UX_04675 [Thiobacillus sp.]
MRRPAAQRALGFVRAAACETVKRIQGHFPVAAPAEIERAAQRARRIARRQIDACRRGALGGGQRHGDGAGDVGVACLERQPQAAPDVFLAQQTLLYQTGEQRRAGRRQVAAGEPQRNNLALPAAVALRPLRPMGVAVMHGFRTHQAWILGEVKQPGLALAERLQPLGTQRLGHSAARMAGQKIGDARVGRAVGKHQPPVLDVGREHMAGRNLARRALEVGDLACLERLLRLPDRRVPRRCPHQGRREHAHQPGYNLPKHGGSVPRPSWPMRAQDD